MSSHVCVRIFSAANELSQAHRGNFIPKGQLSKATGTRMSVRPASTETIIHQLVTNNSVYKMHVSYY